MQNVSNAECGMRNQGPKLMKLHTQVNLLSIEFRIPRSAFRI